MAGLFSISNGWHFQTRDSLSSRTEPKESILYSRPLKQNRMISSADLKYLQRCVDLAREALEAGDAPFGSVLVDAAGHIMKEDRNRAVTDSDVTLHPEFTLAKWAQANLTMAERTTATVYTSGEHCPMCAAAHANVGLGRIVYASSTAQLVQWRIDLGIEPGVVAPLPINQVAPNITVDGPAPGLDDQVRELHWIKKTRQ